MAVDPQGRFAYVVNAVDNNVSGYRIDANQRRASRRSMAAIFRAGKFPRSLVVDPGGRFACVANQVGNNVSVFRISETGALTEINGSPFVTGVGPFSVANQSHRREHAFVVNEGGGNISKYPNPERRRAARHCWFRRPQPATILLM